MLAIRWARRVLDGLLVAAILAVVLIGALTLVSQALHGRALVITGGSMEPSIPLGAFVLTLPQPASEYKVGDAVTVAQEGRTPYTHRIIRIATLPPSASVAGGTYVETKGDANGTPEQVLVSIADVVGRVAITIPFLGFLAATLAAPVGVLGFLAVCITMVAVASACDELEERMLARRARAAERSRADDGVPDIEARLTLVAAADRDAPVTAAGADDESDDVDDVAATGNAEPVDRAEEADEAHEVEAWRAGFDREPEPGPREVDAA